MKFLNYAGACALFLVLALFGTACGSDTNTSGNSNNTSTNNHAGSARTVAGTKVEQSPVSTVTIVHSPVATAAHAVVSTPARNLANDLIHSTQVMINGEAKTVLTNARDHTLYYRTTDTASSVCSGACTGTWPPLLNSGMPNSSIPLSGKLNIVKTANGDQVEYNGHPLYTYTGDTAPGEAKGQGVGGIWSVATSTLS